VVRALRRRLKLRTNVEVVRRALRLLADATERQALKEAYRQASMAARGTTAAQIEDLDHLAAEGLDRIASAPTPSAAPPGPRGRRVPPAPGRRRGGGA